MKSPGDGHVYNEGATPFSASVAAKASGRPATQEASVAPEAKGSPQTAKLLGNAALKELVADCYRQINAQQYAELRAWFPDDGILAEKLKSLKHRGNCVAPEASFGLFVTALMQFA
jgi:hypothetical protein